LQAPFTHQQKQYPTIPNEQNNQLLILFFYSSSYKYKCEKHTGGGLYSKVEMAIETNKKKDDPSLWASS
jgi:hypothetical protein